MTEHVIIVDPEDREIGTEEKLRAHERGLLHRAISVLVYDSRGRMLLQRRAAGKYHCPGLWANTCCSHPRPGEDAVDAAHRRLQEEMGFDCPLREEFVFTYRATFDNGLVEHEVDHVFSGVWSGEPSPDPSEVGGYRWMRLDEIRAGIARAPEAYAPWFRLIVEKL